MISVSLILPDIRSTHNVGAIFRSAEIFGVKHIYICGYTPYPLINNDIRLPHISNKLDKQISKTALGTEKLVSFSYYKTAELAIAQAKQDGCQIIALEQTPSSTMLNKAKFNDKVAIILGREVEGIDENIINLADFCVEIPQKGTKESINVSNACAIMLYHISTI